MAKQKAGAKKLRRSGKDKAYYAAYKTKLASKKAWRRVDREKRILAAAQNRAAWLTKRLATDIRIPG